MGLRLCSVQAQVILMKGVPAEFTSGAAWSPKSLLRHKRAHLPGASVFREKDGWIRGQREIVIHQPIQSWESSLGSSGHCRLWWEDVGSKVFLTALRTPTVQTGRQEPHTDWKHVFLVLPPH